MTTNIFPYAYNQKVDAKTEEKIKNAREQNTDRVNYINKQHTSKPSNKCLNWGLGIGWIGGFYACSCVCLGHLGQEDDGTGTGFIIWMVMGIVCTLIGYAIDKVAMSAFNDNEANIASRISMENRELDKKIEDIKKEAEVEKQHYLKAFESNAQNMSVQFAESELAKEVINWMTNGFEKSIDASDRRSHVEQIVVPFQFKVLVNKITCNLGTYDFELQRCRNLTNPLEQTALARAIATAIQLNIIMKYPKDASGTDISINIDYSFASDYPTTTITYIAPNGNYKPVRNW